MGGHELIPAHLTLFKLSEQHSHHSGMFLEGISTHSVSRVSLSHCRQKVKAKLERKKLRLALFWFNF